MENYKDLIVSLIKANRKYPGCESILEDIVEDVYEHAEVVLNNVQNESVITSYLNKIVMTSIITVSRRMGIQSTRNTNAAPIQFVQTPAVASHEHTEEVESAETAELDLAYQEPSDDLELLNEDAELEEIGEKSEFEDEASELESEPETNISYEDINDNAPESEEAKETEDFEENILEEEISEEEEKEEKEEEIETPDVDKTLVDKMINGIPPVEEVLELDSEIDEDILAELPSEEVSAIDNDIELPEEDSTLLAEEEEISEEEEVLEEAVPSGDNSSDLSEIFEISGETETSLLPDDEVEELPEISENSEEEETIADEDKPAGEFKQPSYACFEYTPEKIEVETDEIIKQIQDLQNKYSEDILKIFKLKYKENLSVDEIASELDIDDNTVLGILNELVYIVKD